MPSLHSPSRFRTPFRDSYLPLYSLGGHHNPLANTHRPTVRRESNIQIFLLYSSTYFSNCGTFHLLLCTWYLFTTLPRQNQRVIYSPIYYFQGMLSFNFLNVSMPSPVNDVVETRTTWTLKLRPCSFAVLLWVAGRNTQRPGLRHHARVSSSGPAEGLRRSSLSTVFPKLAADVVVLCLS